MLRKETVVAVCVWATAGLVATPLYLYVSPRLEEHFLPILTDQRIIYDTDDRTPGKFCFTWEWTKARAASPVVSAWSIVAEDTGVIFPAITTRERDGEVLRGLNPAPTGPGKQDLCVAIPKELDTISGLSIKGQINYRPSHGLWTVWQNLPTIRVPALP